MPAVTQPDLIEVSDFSGGWSPDGLDETEDPTSLADVLNLLPDRSTGALQTRPGFNEIAAVLTDADLDSDHEFRQLYHYHGNSLSYIIAVVSNGVSEVDNVQLWAYDLLTPGWERFDTGNANWSNPTSAFWFQTIDGTLYGGSKGNPMFSWDGTTYDGDVATPTAKEWVDDTGGSVNTASEYGRDYAWTGREYVEYGGDIFMPVKDIRYSPWETDERYVVGDRVSRKLNSYHRSYRCIKTHTADSGKAPDNGADWNTYWKRVKLPAPQNEDNETNADWALIPPAGESPIGAWFANRLFIRFDGQGDNSRLQYSAPIKPEKGEDIPETVWRPDDWAPGNDLRGQGGGWIPFNDGKSSGPVVALHPYGQYLVVFKRRAVYVLSGSDDTTWTVRRVGHGAGAVGPQAVVEYDGLVYFLSDDGLYATDGTAIEAVPGNEKVQRWLRERLDGLLTQAATDGLYPTLFEYDGFIGISLADASDTDENITLFYEPETGAFWKTNLPVRDWLSYRVLGADFDAFIACEIDAGAPKRCVFKVDTALTVDDDLLGSSGTTNISWYAQGPWLTFGLTREERRIRRVWGLVKGPTAQTYTLLATRNYDAGTTGFTTNRQRTVTYAGYVEGLVMPDAHAWALKVSGDRGGSVLFGYGVDTQPRRRRYHA